MTRGQNVIFGVVRDSTGKPVAQARVYFIEGPGVFPDIAAMTDANGAFSLSAPLAGAYRIECTADGFTPATIEVMAISGTSKQVEIEIRLTHNVN